MLGSAYFIPGTVLWLPRQKDIRDFDRHHPYNTVPQKCFGHPILVISEDESFNYVTVLILTSFGGGNNIGDRVKYRRQKLQDYVPIHPAPRLFEGTPSLRLSASQEFVKQIWADVQQPRQCPQSWLQATWPQIWKWNGRGRTVEPSSLHSLALYATQQRYSPKVYGKLLEKYTAPTILPYPQSGPTYVDIPENNHNVTLPAIATRPGVAHHPLFLPTTAPSNCSWHVSTVPEPFLPPTYHSLDQTTHTYQMAGVSRGSSRNRGPSVVAFSISLLKALLLFGVITGGLWVGYMAVNYLITAYKDTFMAITSTM